MSIWSRRNAGLAVFTAAAGIAVLAATAVGPTYAQTSSSALLTECQQALGYASRTPADLAWLHQCVSALSPPKVTPTTTAPPPPSTPWPTAATTGLPVGTALTPATACDLRVDNEVITGKLFDCEVNIYAKGVVIRNSVLHGGGRWGAFVRDGGSATFERDTVQPASGCNGDAGLTGSNFTATAVRLINWGDGYFLSGPNVLIRDSYAKMCAPKDSGEHSDGVQGYHAGPNVTIQHNQWDQRCVDQTGNPADNACSVTAPIFWGDDSGNGLTYDNNLVRGGGYSIRIHAGTGHHVTNNVVDRSWQFGPVSSNCPNIAVWSANRVANVNESQALADVAALACSGDR